MKFDKLNELANGDMNISNFIRMMNDDHKKRCIDTLYAFIHNSDLKGESTDYITYKIATDYGTWIQKNCIVSRNGFRLEPSLKEEISNEKAYELYLESLKSKV